MNNYAYNNSIEDADAQFHFRMVDSKLLKTFVEEMPEWAKTILKGTHCVPNSYITTLTVVGPSGQLSKWTLAPIRPAKRRTTARPRPKPLTC